MVGSQRDGLVRELRDGKQDRGLHALLRDPLPSSDSAIAASIWRARVERDHGQALATLKAESEAIAWARSAIDGGEYATSALRTPATAAI